MTISLLKILMVYVPPETISHATSGTLGKTALVLIKHLHT